MRHILGATILTVGFAIGTGDGQSDWWIAQTVIAVVLFFTGALLLGDEEWRS